MTDDTRSIKINLPIGNGNDDGGNEQSVAYNARAVCSPPPKELESLNNATVLR